MKKEKGSLGFIFMNMVVSLANAQRGRKSRQFFLRRL
jgi:hypothetical protein